MTTLRLGSAGPDVAALQDHLRELGFSPGTTDGIFGPSTFEAVIAFQRREGLLPDGIAGPRTAAALALPDPPPIPSAILLVTTEIAARMFPQTPLRNVEQNLPVVLQALLAPQLTEKSMILMALATIRAEAESFQPLSEIQSASNTSPGGAPFDLYDHRKDLGNQGPPDGGRFRGRGFVQLTGRANYLVNGRDIGLADQLLGNPELANSPDTAARLLANFLKRQEYRIKQALLLGDLKMARCLVNGGSNGLNKFIDAYQTGDRLIPDD
jgi:peptidoglycan L-alanyl-D-glutamate endopeptidase CwlK